MTLLWLSRGRFLLTMDKYVYKSGEIVHCPSCRGVVLRDLKFDPKQNTVSFMMRCAHCSHYIAVTIHDGGGAVIEVKEKEKQTGA